MPSGTPRTGVGARAGDAGGTCRGSGARAGACAGPARCRHPARRPTPQAPHLSRARRGGAHAIAPPVYGTQLEAACSGGESACWPFTQPSNTSNQERDFGPSG